MNWERFGDVISKMSEEELKIAINVFDLISMVAKDAYIEIEKELIVRKPKRDKEAKSNESSTGEGTS